MSSCEVCNELWQFFSSPDTGKTSINLGSFEEALGSNCPDHTRIIEEFKKIGDDDDNTDLTTSSDVGFIRGGGGHSTSLYQSIEKLGLVWNLLAVQKPEVRNHPGNARVLDPDWIDLSLIDRWKRDCFSLHGAKCENPLKIPPVAPAWLVDVTNKCIVPGGDGMSYVALSYRSGEGTMLPLHQTALSELQRDGALENSELWNRLSLKIQHAILLATAIGERYLWVDSLCIDHNDRAATSEQLNLMTAIYAGAIFTIIAADGDRAGGIDGLRDISQPREINQKVFQIGQERLVVRNTGIFVLEQFHKYHTRSWTYQEFKMSPRKLLFMKGEVHWLCNCSEWHEELILGAEVDKYLDPRPQVLSSGYPDLGSLSNMLSNYNKKELTYDEDALAAISGLLTVFSRSFTGGFLYGMPEMLFDRALAWMPQWPHTNMRKRQSSGNPSHIGFTATDLPTWSWVAWQGLFSFRYGEAVRVNDRQYWIEELTPITEWYTSSTPSGEHRRRIRSTWFEKRERRKDVNEPLPNGWSRLPAPTTGEFRDEPMLYPDGCGQHLYKHHTFPDEDCDKWYYPFDVPDVQTSTPFSMPEQTRYLFCKTWKASVFAHRFVDRHFGENNHVLTLRKKVNEAEIGKLHLQTDDQLKLWPELESKGGAEMGSKIEHGRTVELVAIAHGLHFSKTFNEELQRYGHPLAREERVTVLWVEWESGVAYRLACGYVEKGAWDSLPHAVVDLVLG